MTDPEITVVSWNMYCFNKKLDDAFAFIQSQPFDVMCIQEVPEGFLSLLRTLPLFMVESPDSVWREKNAPGNVQRDYHVILSKHPIVADATYPVVEHRSRKFRARLFRSMMRYIANWRSGSLHNRTSHSADITFNGKIIRVFSTHLELATPAIRKNEFEHIVRNLSTDHQNIICGDFNILESWLMKPLNFLLGGSLLQAFPWYNERAEMEQAFQAAGLSNIFKSRITHKIAHSQLDHILVPVGTNVIDQKVLLNTHGSDHRPIVATLNIEVSP
jgi:endonuclease/exonuclease/phosphatase family metal-dependent hydrolase